MPSQSALAASQTTLTVKATDQNGVVLHMWTVITQNGTWLYAGHTPLNFTRNVGQLYTVRVSESNTNVVFSQWTNGDTNNSRTVTLGSLPKTVTARYHTHSVGSITSALSSNLVIVGKSVMVSGTVFDDMSNPMAGVNLAITIGSFSATSTSNSSGTYNSTILTTAAGTFTVNVKTISGTVSAPPLSLK